MPEIALWAALAALLAALFFGASEARRVFTEYSVRYESGISGQDAHDARAYAVSQGEAGVAWASFWREDEARLSSPTAEADSMLITFSGDGRLAWDAVFLCGAMPGASDASGCALSEALAFALFGSTDIIGQGISVSSGGPSSSSASSSSADDTLYVRGVFMGDEPSALRSAGIEGVATAWQAAELSATAAPLSISDASAFAAASGLSKGGRALPGRAMRMAAGGAALLPIALLLVCALIRLCRLLPRRLRGMAALAVCFALALALPSLLALMPGWAVPDQWSNFAFWQSLAEDLRGDFEAFFAGGGATRDIAGAFLLMRQGALCIAASLAALALCFMNSNGGNHVRHHA